jgi:hypothetical protein
MGQRVLEGDCVVVGHEHEEGNVDAGEVVLDELRARPPHGDDLRVDHRPVLGAIG